MLCKGEIIFLPDQNAVVSIALMCILSDKQDNYQKNYILDCEPLPTSHSTYLLFVEIASGLSEFKGIRNFSFLKKKKIY